MLRLIFVGAPLTICCVVNLGQPALDTSPINAIATTSPRVPQTLEQKEPAPIYSEKTAFSSLQVWENESFTPIRGADRMVVNGSDGKPFVASKRKYRRLFQNDVLYGDQLVELDPHFLDDFQLLPIGVSPWDPLIVAGAIQAYDIRQEPLTYYHRSGPVGAIFGELRRRKNGADAESPVGIFGLQIGAQACYAMRGQKVTFYETDPLLKRLTADSDQYFSHISDAKKRGVDLDIRVGNQRVNLKADKDRKFALLLIDQCESFPVPKDLLTVEALKLYFERMPDDGILALHVSNKYFRLSGLCRGLRPNWASPHVSGTTTTQRKAARPRRVGSRSLASQSTSGGSTNPQGIWHLASLPRLGKMIG